MLGRQMKDRFQVIFQRRTEFFRLYLGHKTSTTIY
jgi:hypothetical protein